MTLSKAEAFIDTDVIIRLLTGDDPVKQAAALALFQHVEQGRVAIAAPVTVIADAVYELHSARLYHRSKEEVTALLLPLVMLPRFLLENRPAVIAALELYAQHPTLDFSDALIAALMAQSGPPRVYS